MSSEAPSPSAAVLARRASRQAKSMREESGSEEDCDEPDEWEDDDEVASEEDGSEEEVRVSNAQRGRVRLHWASQSSTGLEVDDERRKSLGEKGWARRAVVVRGVEPSVAADFEAVPGREEYDLGEDGSAAWAQDKVFHCYATWIHILLAPQSTMVKSTIKAYCVVLKNKSASTRTVMVEEAQISLISATQREVYI